MKTPLRTLRAGGFTLAAAFLQHPCHAATVSNITAAGVQQPTGVAIDVSSYGGVNWAVWDARSSTPSGSMAPYTMMSLGTGTINGLSPGGSSTSVRGTDSVGTYVSTFTWTGGTAAPTGDGILTGGFGGTSINSVGNGVQLSIENLAPLALGQVYRISVFGAPYNSTATLTASATGAPPFSQFSQVAGGSTRHTELYQFTYAPESTSDIINLEYVLTTDGGGTASHVTLQGVAIDIIPEPSALLLALGGAVLGLRRRRG